MSSTEKDGKPIILLVSDTDDGSLRACADALVDAGASLRQVPDVYAAMALLAGQASPDKVLVDIRSLDDQEMAFLRLAHRHYPASEVIVPDLEGTAQRITSYGPGVRAVAVGSIVESVSANARQMPSPDESPATPAEEPAGLSAMDDPHDRPLSTEGGPDTGDQGPPLHEAVRMRMTGNDPKAVRRTPPRKPPPVSTQPQATLSPEEMDALLTDEEVGGAEKGFSAQQGEPGGDAGDMP